LEEYKMELENKVAEQLDSIKSDNLKALQKLFPSVIKDGQLDLEALKEEIGNFEEVKEEKYDFTWTGKQEAKKKAQETIVARTLNLIEKDSVNPDNTENLYIEGDNLEVLKLLRQNYRGAIKMIYIDPPYNTGNDFVYKDNFKINQEESARKQGYIDENNQRLQKNSKDNNRFHANWLSMMYPRLKIARDLLSEDGVIFISIDDTEEANLKKICDEIFGEENYEKLIWKKKGGAGNTEKIIGNITEYILCIFKNKTELSTNYREIIRKYSYEDEKGKYNLEGIEKTNLGTYERPTMLFEIEDPKTGKKFLPSENMRWTLGKETVNDYIKNNKLYFDYKNSKVKLIKREEDYEKSENVFLNLLDNQGSLKTAKDYLKNTLDFSREIFDTPKPVELIEQLLNISSKKDSIILDFFSGSATTADAVMQLNAEDGGNRKFIMVQIDEEVNEKSEAYKFLNEINKPTNISEIGKERIRRAGEKIKTEIEENNKKVKDGEELKEVPDIGFKVFRTADTNINWRNIRNISNYTDLPFNEPDRLDFIENYNDKDVVYEVLLHQRDLPLSEKLEVLSTIGDRTYLYASSYLVCLETNITETLIKELANLNPLPVKFIFRDSAFKSDINLKESTFRYLKTLVEKNSGMNKRTYTIEFI